MINTFSIGVIVFLLSWNLLLEFYILPQPNDLVSRTSLRTLISFYLATLLGEVVVCYLPLEPKFWLIGAGNLICFFGAFQLYRFKCGANLSWNHFRIRRMLLLPLLVMYMALIEFNQSFYWLPLAQAILGFVIIHIQFVNKITRLKQNLSDLQQKLITKDAQRSWPRLETVSDKNSKAS